MSRKPASGPTSEMSAFLNRWRRGSQCRPSVHLRPSGPVTLRRNMACQGKALCARGRRFPSTSAAFSARSAAASSRCSSRSCATRSTPRRPASPRRSRRTSCRSRCCSSSRGRSANASGAAVSYARPTSSTRCSRLLAALAPDLGSFLVVRALQGSANAFLTPLLLAGLADEVAAAARSGRAIGTFAAVQTSAVALAPLGGGALGALDWRLAFLAQSVVAGTLALFPPADGRARPEGELPPRAADGAHAPDRACSAPRRSPATRAWSGSGFLVAVLAADEFGLSLGAARRAAGRLRRRRHRARPGGRWLRRSLRAGAGGAGRDRGLRACSSRRSASLLRRSSSARCGSPPASARRCCGPGSTC